MNAEQLHGRSSSSFWTALIGWNVFDCVRTFAPYIAKHRRQPAYDRHGKRRTFTQSYVLCRVVDRARDEREDVASGRMWSDALLRVVHTNRRSV